ncbi:MAG: hypothetical protein J6K16_02000 [Alphaproteobacteria bacterium]|nr:hypothetical protein [Alphaproteobacteria bacterium]
MNRLKALKIIVFIFTFLLIFGTISLVGILFNRAQNSDKAISSANLGLSAEVKIKQITADNGLLYLLVSAPDKADEIIVFNPAKAKIVSNITLN